MAAQRSPALIGPKGGKRLNSRRGSRWHIARNRCHAAQNADRRGERARIGRPNAEQEDGEQPGDAERDQQSETQTHSRQCQALPQDERHHMRSARAQAARTPISGVRCTTEYDMRP